VFLEIKKINHLEFFAVSIFDIIKKEARWKNEKD